MKSYNITTKWYFCIVSMCPTTVCIKKSTIFNDPPGISKPFKTIQNHSKPQFLSTTQDKWQAPGTAHTTSLPWYAICPGSRGKPCRGRGRCLSCANHGTPAKSVGLISQSIPCSTLRRRRCDPAASKQMPFTNPSHCSSIWPMTVIM